MKLTNIIKTTACLMLLFAITGCTTMYDAAVDIRSLQEQTEDAKIEARIKQIFFDNQNVKALSTSIYSYYGNVYIIGEADDNTQASAAETLAKQVEGVNSATAYMPIKRDDDLCGVTENIGIKIKVYTALAKDDTVSVGQVSIKAIQCKVVLLGLVQHGSQIRKSISISKTVENVRGVKSFLKVIN